MASCGAQLQRPITFLVCDLQEKVREACGMGADRQFQGAIFHFDSVVQTTSKLLRAAAVLDIPVLGTEQYPKGLGRTVPRIADAVSAVPKHATEAKTAFSMVSNDLVLTMQQRATGQHASYIDVDFAICGIESHVCVLQTVLDLRQRGARVHVVQDAVSSCNREEIPTALEAMRTAGADITTSESLLFRILGNSSHPHFRAVSALIVGAAHLVALTQQREEKETTARALAALLGTEGA
ncbi:hypothetical protein MSPP1_002710 [Malassezia sp. CBS 17886]|nr:hypothetical protein MSPP1_002710 [Malassezia sp. CBS 17886]